MQPGQNRPSSPRDSGPPSRRSGYRRPLNISAIKSVIVFVTGGITALLGGLTGLGAQVMFAPMLTWMLGFAPEKAQATAMTFAAWTASAAVAGAYVGGATPTGFILSGLMLAIGAVLGAVIVAGIAKKVQGKGWRRTFQTIGIMFTLAVIVQVSHMSGLFAGRPNFEEWHSPGTLLLIGLAVGAATQLMSLPSGMLLVPAIYFLSGMKTATGSYAGPAVSLAMFVVALASILPAIAYAKKGLVDTVYRTPIITAGILGGFAGGYLAGQILDRVVIVVSAVIAMFLCARELSRSAFETSA